MEQEGIHHHTLDVGNVRAMSHLSAFRSMLTLLSEWLMIVAAIALSLHFHHPLVYLMAWMLIGSRMYALYSLLHDGIHYLLYPDRKINDWICRLLLAWPLFIDFSKMRKAHLAHHQHLQTPKDPELVHLDYPEFQFPRRAGDIFLTFLLDISGVNFIKYRAIHWSRSIRKVINDKSKTDSEEEHRSKEYLPVKAIYYSAIIGLILYMGWAIPFLMFWIVPYITIYQVLNRLRLSTEHFHLDENKKFHTRTVKLNWLERFFLSPHNLGFHTEHHAYPYVPFYRLPALHEMLMDKEEYRNEVIVDRSYAEVIKQYIN